ncbi:MAG: hypothetical protein GC171_14540 [Terrimonas sp.]|nr:hypothetical protein [Terrimonas sp.]
MKKIIPVVLMFVCLSACNNADRQKNKTEMESTTAPSESSEAEELQKLLDSAGPMSDTIVKSNTPVSDTLRH